MTKFWGQTVAREEVYVNKASHSIAFRYRKSISSTNMLCLLAKKLPLYRPKACFCYSLILFRPHVHPLNNTFTCRLTSLPLWRWLISQEYRGTKTQSRTSSALTGLRLNLKTWRNLLTRHWLLGCFLPEWKSRIFPKIFLPKLSTGTLTTKRRLGTELWRRLLMM